MPIAKQVLATQQAGDRSTCCAWLCPGFAGNAVALGHRAVERGACTNLNLAMTAEGQAAHATLPDSAFAEAPDAPSAPDRERLETVHRPPKDGRLTPTVAVDRDTTDCARRTPRDVRPTERDRTRLEIAATQRETWLGGSAAFNCIRST